MVERPRVVSSEAFQGDVMRPLRTAGDRGARGVRPERSHSPMRCQATSSQRAIIFCSEHCLVPGSDSQGGGIGGASLRCRGGDAIWLRADAHTNGSFASAEAGSFVHLVDKVSMREGLPK